MAIEVKMREEKWRLAIESEEWEFPNKEVMKETFNTLVDLKDKFGRVKLKVHQR